MRLTFVLPALLIASAAGGELIKAARYLGDRSTQERGAIIYLGHKQQSVLRWLGKYVAWKNCSCRTPWSNLPGQVSKFLLAAGTGLVGGLAGFAGNAILDIPDPVLRIPRRKYCDRERQFDPARKPGSSGAFAIDWNRKAVEAHTKAIKLNLQGLPGQLKLPRCAVTYQESESGHHNLVRLGLGEHLGQHALD